MVIPGMNPAMPTKRKTTPKASAAIWTGLRLEEVCAVVELPAGDRSGVVLMICPSE
ncbi:hypothetical protein ACFFX0_09930 [Citricoccus parietis]|uniref:Uncharacterized protein n=1 Tax=Citricoccus parietis TaxID=592307 RepID=A0ABV5FZ39_9MICC